MKVCPTCDTTFTDDSLSYCLHDGTQLVSGESEPTVVIERAVPTVPNAVPAKSKNTGLLIGLIVVILIFAIAVIGAALLFFYNRKPDTNVTVRTANNNTSPTPKSATPKPSPSTTPASTPSPATDPAKTDENSDDSDEVTPISWTTSGSTFKTDVGRKYKFECPANGVPEAIWGSDIYSADSSICTAAVHAGIITLESGGNVTVEFRPGRATYGSTERNGITSNTYGEFPHSFVVK